MPKKIKTREQVARMQEKAVRFLRDVKHQESKADEFADMSVDEYAKHKKIEIRNPAKKANAGQGNQFKFHGSFTSKAEAQRKEGKVKGSFIKETGSGKSKRFMVLTPIKNPGRGKRKNSGDSETLYQEFHGQAPAEILEIRQREARKDFAALGTLVQLEIHSKSNCECEIKREKRGKNYVKVAAYIDPECEVYEEDFGEDADERVILAQGARNPGEEDTPQQLYFLGGDQDMTSQMEDRGLSKKDFIDFGEVREVVYVTQKPHLGDEEDTEYFHELGEETGVRPRLMYDRLKKRMYLVGGEYEIRTEGITN